MEVLVAYASRHGATRGIADRIADRLREHGLHADVRAARDVAGLDDLDAVVIGSAVYYGAWMKDAVEFVRKYRDVLAQRPVWVFGSGPLGATGGVEEKAITGLRQAIHPVDVRVFAGALDRSKLGLAERIIAKGVHAPDGDYRDWAAIDAWAEAIATQLRCPAPQAGGSRRC